MDPYKCQKCSSRFRIASQLKRHMALEHPEVKKEQAEEEGESADATVSSTNDSQETNGEDQEEAKVPTPQKRGQKRKANTVVKTEKEEPGSGSTSPRQSKRKPKNARKSVLDIQKEQLTCVVCNSTFETESELEAHEEDCGSKDHLRCDVCQKVFQTTTQLEKHEKIHPHIKKYKCQYCNRRFSLKKDLTRHESTHPTGRPFKCDYCDMRFTSQTTLARHQKSHEDEMPLASPSPKVKRGRGRPPNTINQLKLLSQVHNSDPVEESAFYAQEDDGELPGVELFADDGDEDDEVAMETQITQTYRDVSNSLAASLAAQLAAVEAALPVSSLQDVVVTDQGIVSRADITDNPTSVSELSLTDGIITHADTEHVIFTTALSDSSNTTSVSFTTPGLNSTLVVPITQLSVASHMSEEPVTHMSIASISQPVTHFSISEPIMSVASTSEEPVTQIESLSQPIAHNTMLIKPVDGLTGDVITNEDSTIVEITLVGAETDELSTDELSMTGHVVTSEADATLATNSIYDAAKEAGIEIPEEETIQIPEEETIQIPEEVTIQIPEEETIHVYTTSA